MVGLLSLVLIFVIVLVVLAVLGLRVANEYERAVVFRLGRLQRHAGPGPVLADPARASRRQKKVDLRTMTIDVESQESITKDSVTVKVNAVVWLKIVDPVKSVVAVADYYSASYQVALTSLRNIIGQHDLDEVLKERDKINTALQLVVDAGDRAVGRQGRDGRDEGRRDSRADAARDGPGGAGHAREARAHHQGRGRAGGRRQARRGRRSSSPRTRSRSSCAACR